MAARNEEKEDNNQTYDLYVSNVYTSTIFFYLLARSSDSSRDVVGVDVKGGVGSQLIAGMFHECDSTYLQLYTLIASSALLRQSVHSNLLF